MDKAGPEDQPQERTGPEGPVQPADPAATAPAQDQAASNVPDAATPASLGASAGQLPPEASPQASQAADQELPEHELTAEAAMAEVVMQTELSAEPKDRPDEPEATGGEAPSSETDTEVGPTGTDTEAATDEPEATGDDAPSSESDTEVEPTDGDTEAATGEPEATGGDAPSSETGTEVAAAEPEQTGGDAPSSETATEVEPTGADTGLATGEPEATGDDAPSSETATEVEPTGTDTEAAAGEPEATDGDAPSLETETEVEPAGGDTEAAAGEPEATDGDAPSLETETEVEPAGGDTEAAAGEPEATDGEAPSSETETEVEPTDADTEAAAVEPEATDGEAPSSETDTEVEPAGTDTAVEPTGADTGLATGEPEATDGDAPSSETDTEVEPTDGDTEVEPTGTDTEVEPTGGDTDAAAGEHEATDGDAPSSETDTEVEPTGADTGLATGELEATGPEAAEPVADEARAKGELVAPKPVDEATTETDEPQTEVIAPVAAAGVDEPAKAGPTEPDDGGAKTEVLQAIPDVEVAEPTAAEAVAEEVKAEPAAIETEPAAPSTPVAGLDTAGPATAILPPEAKPVAASEPTTHPTRADLAKEQPASGKKAAKETRRAKKRAKKPKRRRGRKIALTLVIVLVLATVGGAYGAIRFFETRANPGVTLAGLSVVGKSKGEVTNLVDRLENNFQMEFTDGKKKVTGSAKQMGVKFDQAQTVSNVMRAGKALAPWFAINPWSEKPVALVATVNQVVLRDFLDAEFVPAEDEAVNAAVELTEDGTAFEVVAGKIGLGVKVEPVVEAFKVALTGQANGAHRIELIDAPPMISDQAAAKAAETANADMALAITFTSESWDAAVPSFTVPPSTIAEWMEITPSEDGRELNVGFDQAAVERDLPEMLDQTIGKPSRPQITVTRPDNGEDIGVSQWGLNGYIVSGTDALAAQTVAALDTSESITIPVELEEDGYVEERQEAPSDFDVPDGSPWVDVNLSTFRATTYRGTTPINSYIISTGRSSIGHGTPSGTFYVYMKYEFQIMRGPPSDPYEAPTNWVSYFSGGVAFHSAPWNEPNGWGMEVSHGCVNMQTWAAREMFDFAPVGTKVEVHH